MGDVFHGYWWIIIPLLVFGYDAMDRWVSYRRSKDALDLIKAYVAQGKEPPPELVQRLREVMADEEEARTDRPSRRRRYQGDLRAAIFCGFLAGGFWIASAYGFLPGAEGAFRLVALILTCVAGATLAAAMLSKSRHDK